MSRLPGGLNLPSGLRGIRDQVQRHLRRLYVEVSRPKIDRYFIEEPDSTSNTRYIGGDTGFTQDYPIEFIKLRAIAYHTTSTVGEQLTVAVERDSGATTVLTGTLTSTSTAGEWLEFTDSTPSSPYLDTDGDWRIKVLPSATVRWRQLTVEVYYYEYSPYTGQGARA